MNVYVLAGGGGTRMQPWTQLIPKCLLPVGGVPVSRIIINRLLEHGAKNIILCINKQFEKEFRYEFRDLNIKFSISNSPQGTAGEVYYGLNNYPPDGSDFGVIYSDDITEIDYELMLVKHYESENDTTIAITANVPLDIGIVEVKDKKVVEFKEKPLISELKVGTYVWTGVAFLKSTLIPLFVPGNDIAKDIFPEILKRGLKMGTFISDNPWWDIGQIQHYKKVREVFEK